MGAAHRQAFEGLYGFRSRLIEVEAPEGYMLNCEEIRFQVDGGSVYENPVIVVCTDTPAMGRIIIEKTEQQMAGQ